MLRKAFFGVVVAVGLSACGGPLTYKVPSSAKAPGADATIIADIQKEQNTTMLQVDVVNLAPAARIVPGATQYIVWFRKSPAQLWQRVGLLKYDESSRKASLKGSAPETFFELEISVEKELEPASPSVDIIITQAVGK